MVAHCPSHLDSMAMYFACSRTFSSTPKRMFNRIENSFRTVKSTGLSFRGFCWTHLAIQKGILKILSSRFRIYIFPIDHERQELKDGARINRSFGKLSPQYSPMIERQCFTRTSSIPDGVYRELSPGSHPIALTQQLQKAKCSPMDGRPGAMPALLQALRAVRRQAWLAIWLVSIAASVHRRQWALISSPESRCQSRRSLLQIPDSRRSRV